SIPRPSETATMISTAPRASAGPDSLSREVTGALSSRGGGRVSPYGRCRGRARAPLRGAGSRDAWPSVGLFARGTPRAGLRGAATAPDAEHRENVFVCRTGPTGWKSKESSDRGVSGDEQGRPSVADRGGHRH